MQIKATIENGVASISYEAEGRKRIKNIPSEAFCKALLKSADAGKSCLITPIGLRVSARNGDRVMVGYEMPERVAPMTFHKSTQKGSKKIEVKTVIPWGLTFIEFKDTPEGLQWTKFYQLAMKGPLINGETDLYVWPGSNVYDGHNCCIGKIDIPKLNGIEQTGGLPFIFYNGVNNDDLSGGKFTSFKGEDGKTIQYPVDLYATHLVVKDGVAPKPFPYDILKPAVKLKSFLSNGGFM